MVYGWCTTPVDSNKKRDIQKYYFEGDTYSV
jgi:hypothetical protein